MKARTIRLLLLLAALETFGCDDGPFRQSHNTIAGLSAVALYTDSTAGRLDACTLGGSWSMPDWPASTRTDTATVFLSRQAIFSGSSILRDTAEHLAVTLSRRDSLHFDLALPSPFADTVALVLDSLRGLRLSAGWSCPSTFPLALDSALVANGYQADSLNKGTLDLGRYFPID
jgi:hypothetical protein